MKKRSTQQGFTLMELMVVIVIVAILAAVAVPLYINYVRDAQRTEAKAAIGAIVTAEQVYYQKNGGVAYIDLGTLETQKLLDITEAKSKWTFKVSNYSSGPSFDIQATSATDATLRVCYNFDHNTGGKFDDTCAGVAP
jgi:type IV pilus assembly protein PilA